MTTTTSLGGTICTMAGFDSLRTAWKSISATGIHASRSVPVARSMIQRTSVVSMPVRARSGMKAASFPPPSRRSMIGKMIRGLISRIMLPSSGWQPSTCKQVGLGSSCRNSE